MAVSELVFCVALSRVPWWSEKSECWNWFWCITLKILWCSDKK